VADRVRHRAIVPVRGSGVARTLVVLLVAVAGIAGAAEGDVRFEAILEADQASVGDRIGLTLTLSVPAGWSFEARGVGPELGPFRVYDGAWRPVEETDDPSREGWTWSGTVAAFETGDLELPAVRVRGTQGDGSSWSVSSSPRAVRIDSLLDAEARPEDLDIADLKAPVSLDPDWTALRFALGGLIGLLALAGVVVWAHRRWSGNLRRPRPVPDPFDRMPPHEWAFRELKALLAGRVSAQEDVDRFHASLARIVKTYLEGRFRVDLLERTTSEVAPALQAAGATLDVAREATAILEVCDAVKFAGHRPDADACRATVERAYRLIDETRPRVGSASQEGAA
jgi:hypothetical protein